MKGELDEIITIKKMMKQIAETRKGLIDLMELYKKAGLPTDIEKAIADLNELIEFIRDIRNMIEEEGHGWQKVKMTKLSFSFVKSASSKKKQKGYAEKRNVKYNFSLKVLWCAFSPKTNNHSKVKQCCYDGLSSAGSKLYFTHTSSLTKIAINIFPSA